MITINRMNCENKNDECFCWAMDGFPGVCEPCKEREQRIRKEREDFLNAQIKHQISLPDDSKEKIFTTQQIHDTANVHCDKNGFNRLLLRGIRRHLGLV